jgi:hypothetical protein
MDLGGADISSTLNLSSKQLKLAITDKETKLPKGLK